VSAPEIGEGEFLRKRVYRRRQLGGMGMAMSPSRGTESKDEKSHFGENTQASIEEQKAWWPTKYKFDGYCSIVQDI